MSLAKNGLHNGHSEQQTWRHGKSFPLEKIGKNLFLANGREFFER